jgi:hypothetical protein
VISEDSMPLERPCGPEILVAAIMSNINTHSPIRRANIYSLALAPTKDPETAAAPELVSRKLTSETMVLSSRTVPQLRQTVVPAAGSLIKLFSVQFLHIPLDC